MKFDGPIPGENYTSEAKNYPWHRPPDETDFVQIVDKSIKKMATKERTGLILSALESGETILDFVAGTARVSVGNGRLPIDMAILAAGPIARYIESLAEASNIEFERGWEQDPPMLTAAELRAYGGTVEEVEEKDAEETSETGDDASGLMSFSDQIAPEDEQAEMLGLVGEEESEE